MENMSPESLFRKAQALGDDIREMESIDTLAAYHKAKFDINKVERKKTVYSLLMRYAALLAIPLLMTSLVLGYLYFDGAVFKKDNRSVELKGEAYFEIQADQERPFYVNTRNGLSVYVYGTKFNVNAYENDDYIETVLEKGKVNVITPNRETIVLTPGEQLLYDKQSQKSVKNKVDVYGKIAWKDGKLVFRNTPLEEIFKRLERHFNVDIQYNNRCEKEYRYRATFRDETLSQILDYLAKSAKMKWKIEESQQQADDTFTKKKIIVDLY